MNNALYGIRGETDGGKTRLWIAANGGRIARERLQPLLTGDQIQFHVIVDGEYWMLSPASRVGYSWLKVRDKCECGEPICLCTSSLARSRKTPTTAREETL